MTYAIAVIGANYGDEGKGLATDFFTREYSRDGRVPLVVRGNGGAQAGHTVVDKDKRHVFGHVGAGTFAGASTYLASNFIINPLLLNKELATLTKQGVSVGKLLAHRDCRVTTVFDMALNSIAETARGQNRHGSCGVGINETVTRHQAGFFLTAELIKEGSVYEIEAALKRIKNEWVPYRLDALSRKLHVGRKENELFYSTLDASLSMVAQELKECAEVLSLDNPKNYINHAADPVIIEGAQGLMLDEFLGDFPHVTRSVTGLPSSIRAAHECGATHMCPAYITRAYTTRHGAGDLVFEGTQPAQNNLFDQTNVPNQWQGTLRYAPLNLQRISQFIHSDITRSVHVADAFSIELLKPIIFLTCMDQVGEWVNVVDVKGELQRVVTERLPRFIESELGISVSLIAYGPTVKDVKVCYNNS